MIYKNIEIHNAAEIVDLGDGFTWNRFPGEVCDAFECPKAKVAYNNVTGVELRFIIKGEEARIRMSSLSAPEKGGVCTFQVFYGELQGGWGLVHGIIPQEPTEFVFKKPDNTEKYKKITEEFRYDRDPDVVRVIFNRGRVKIWDVDGEVEPPKPEQHPKRTLLSYGSSITHGSSSMDMCHSWVSLTAHHLNMDHRNLGMAGSCWMEPAVIDYIAEEGIKGRWDLATLELGINVLDWEEDKVYERVRYAVSKVAGLNPDKPVLVISPFYCYDDYDGGTDAEKWRRIIPEVVEELGLSNVYYKSGLYFLDNMSYISADEVHPNIYGVQRIADRMTEFLKKDVLKK